MPTEASVAGEKEILTDSEKSESFAELYEKYDEQFIKNSTSKVKEVDENPLHKRSSEDGSDEDEKVEDEGKSVIESVENIVDPEVRKEFELELENSGKVAVDETQDSAGSEIKSSVDPGTEYNPNYSEKVVNVSENDTAGNSVDTKPDQLNEPDLEYTTIAPSSLEVVEVFKEIFQFPNGAKVEPVTPSNLMSAELDFDPIMIITESYRSLNFEATTIPNDKFVGYQPSEDLVEPGDETTERDHFFNNKDEVEQENVEKAAEKIVDALEYIGIYGKSLNVGTESSFEGVAETTTAPLIPETKTEIIEVNTEFSVSIQVSEPKEILASTISASESSTQSSSGGKSSEESNDSHSTEKVDKVQKVKKIDNDSVEDDNSSEENSAKEVIDSDDLKILDITTSNNTQPNRLIEDLYKDTLNHEVKKKDHPAKSLLMTADENTIRMFTPEDEIAQHLEDKLKPEQPTTTTIIYESFEEFVTTIADGIKLTKELKANVNSFRGDADESQTILDTNRDAVSSKNLKAALVNIVDDEEMTLENRVVENAKFSYGTVAIFGIVSVLAVTMFFAILRSKATRLIVF